MKPAIFLDRDGVLVENIQGDYIREKSQIKILPSAKQSIAKLHEHGFEIVIVTNQACVNKGIVSAEEAIAIQNEVIYRLDPSQTILIKSELCPHASNEGCYCRKPQPGMILSAATKHGLDLSRSYMIGDAPSDIQAATAAGVASLFVLSGRGGITDLGEINDYVRVFNHIGDATDYICEGMK